MGVLRSLIHIRVFISVVLIVVIVIGVVVLVIVGRSVDELAGEIENGARYHELLEEVAYFVVVSGALGRIGAIGVWRTPIAIRGSIAVVGGLAKEVEERVALLFLGDEAHVAGALVLLLPLDHVHGEVLVVRVERERHLVGLGEQRVGEEGFCCEVEPKCLAVGRLGVHAHAHVVQVLEQRLVAFRDHVADDVRVGAWNA